MDTGKRFPNLANAFKYAMSQTVTLFGATVNQMGFGPLASQSQALGIELECRPCSDHGPKTCPLGHFRCMSELQVDHVYEHCLQVLVS